MGNKINNIFEKKDKKIPFNYYCKQCGEIPLLHFIVKTFDLICSSHRILNIPINQFYHHISIEYKCFFCNKIPDEKEIEDNFFYCHECNKNFCTKCIKSYEKHEDKSHNVINIKDKYIICKIHKKNHIKFCLNCKINLCELCNNKNHINHYMESFIDIYPSKEDFLKYKEISKEIKSGKLKEVFEIKNLLINKFSKNIANYYYIMNINNIISCAFKNLYTENIQSEKIKFINEIISKDKNDVQNKILIKSMVKKNVDDNFLSTIWCMKKLNDIQINKNQKLELIGIGCSRKILLFNILNFRIYQIINEHNGTVYSLDQHENDINYLFSSSNDSTINIYKLNSDFKYGLIQKLKKSNDKTGGEINKVVCLSNKLLVCGDHRSITIWKNNSKEAKRIYYEDIYEIIVNKDTCHILEVNPSIFVATQYTEHHFQVYKNDGKIFPLLGELKNVKTHGVSSNGLSKISDKLVCSAGESEFNIICVEPLQVIQKFQINRYISLYYIYATKDNYVYCKSDINTFIQYKIIYDEENNFVELAEIGRYLCAYLRDKAIAPLEDGRIFFTEEKEGEEYYQMIA